MKSLRMLLFAVGAPVIYPIGAEESDQYIEEIVVTATYRETSLMDTAQTISALNARLIREMGATDMTELYGNIPGLNMTTDSTGFHRYIIRGVSSQTGHQSFQQTSSTIGVYVDDIVLTSANGPLAQFGGALFDIDRIEVLKGPQGTLFGEGSQGGTIRFIYNEPNANALDFTVKAGVGFQDHSNSTPYRFDAMVNVPISEKLAVRGSVFQELEAGYIDKVDLGEDDVNEYESTGGRLAAKWWPTDKLIITANYYHTESQTKGASFANRPYEEDQNVRIPGMPPFSIDTSNLYNLRFEYDLGFATLTSTTSYVDRHVNSLIEFPIAVANLFDSFVGFTVNLAAISAGGTGPIPCNVDPNPNPSPFGIPFQTCPWGDMMSLSGFDENDTSKTDRWSQEFRLVSAAEGDWLWTAGAFWKDSNDLRRAFQPFNMTAGREDLSPLFLSFFNDPSSNHKDSVEEYAVFGEVTYMINEDWDITLGARFSNLDQAFENTVVTTQDNPISPKLGIAWRPNENILAYATYATGFRPGNVNNGQEFNARQFMTAGLPQEEIDKALNNITYKGDEVSNFELGIKTTLWDGRAQMTAAAYYLDWKDMIQLVVDPTIPSVNNSYNQNTGAAVSQGVEIEVTAVPTQDLRVRFGGHVGQAETDQDNLSAGAPKGNKLIYSPDWSFSIAADYTISLWRSLEGNLRADYQRVGKQYADRENTLVIPEHDLTNLRFTILDSDDSRWSVSLFVNNLADNSDLLRVRTMAGFPLNWYQQPRHGGIEFTWHP